jgi:TonB family protein
MNRLEKKCFITSAAVHGLLFGAVIIFGSGFFVRKEKAERVPHLLTAYDPRMVTDALTMGGNPNVLPQPADPTPKPPAPQPEPPKAETKPQVEEPKPEPKRTETPKPERLTSKDAEPVTKNPKVKDTPKPRLDDLSLKPVVRPNKNTSKPRKDDSDEKKAETEARNHANAVRKANIAKFNNAINSLSTGLSSRTPVVIESGPGGSAFSAVNYDDLIASKYYNAWVAPNGVSDSTPSVLVTITVTRDGTVMSGRILKGSGNAALDRSIQNVLNNVTFIEPFPEGAKDQQRTFKISFNLEAKRQLG